MTQTIRFFNRGGDVTGEAHRDESGAITYTGSAESIMHNSVLNKGADWAWARFSDQSNGYSSSRLVES